MSVKPVAVVTGIGIAAPNGLGTDAYWASTLEGRSGIGRITRFDPKDYPAVLAGELPGFDPARYLSDRLLPQTDRVTQISLAVTDWALADAAADPKRLSEYDMGVVTASASGGFEFGQRELENLWSKGRRYVSAYQSFAWFYAVNTGQISIRHGMRGPSSALVTEQAGGLDALAQARRQIRAGTPFMLAGGVDASLCPWGWVAQLAGGRLSRSEDPARAYLPFETRACGFVPGEGGAILVLEDKDAARARKAPNMYGEIAGYAASFDPAPGSGRSSALRRAIQAALDDAEADPSEVDAVFADGAGLPGPDKDEAQALSAVFGPYGVPVTVPKSMTGRLYSGGASLDVAAALLALQDGILPATAHVSRPSPDLEIDLVVGEPRRIALRTVLVIARGEGGFNSALVVRAPAGSPGSATVPAHQNQTHTSHGSIGGNNA
ncbi:ketosynthase chain-length factor (plasmid) [Streptomyces sp. NBC_00390]|uniref:ketosynthase chain-length factor n=1 Tax=Streptomyces sp. NBC_00390 TaxID=2975736 RepID=UPI002E1B9071